jgi:hypothetical protein
LLLGIFLLFAKTTWAAGSAEFVGPPVELVGPPVEQVETQPSLLEEMDAPRDYLSERIVDFSTRIDHFFGDERYFQEHNKSVIQMEMTELMEEGGNSTFAFEGKAKLDLPSAQRRFQLVLESNPEKKSTGDLKKDQSVPPTATTTPDKYSAALRYEKAEVESPWHFSSDAGVKVQYPLDPFVRARTSYSLPLWDWRFKLAETVFWFSTTGLGETTQFDMEHVLSEPVLFRATTTVTCYEAPQNCDSRQDLSIFHTLDDRTALLYQLSVMGVSQPTLQETDYSLLFRYRYRMHKDWVFIELDPQLNFPRTDDFRLNALLLLRLEVLFGATK